MTDPAEGRAERWWPEGSDEEPYGRMGVLTGLAGAMCHEPLDYASAVMAVAVRAGCDGNTLDRIEAALADWCCS